MNRITVAWRNITRNRRSRPVLQFVAASVRAVARVLPMPAGMAFYFTTLALVPLLGSFIAEPAAMTVAALILRDRYYSKGISTRLKYATLGVLFVNVSIGGTLTPYAAPPVLMVAGKYGWDTAFMAATFGWKAALAVGVNALVATLVFGRELAQFPGGGPSPFSGVPRLVVILHVLFLGGVVFFGHHPPVFLLGDGKTTSLMGLVEGLGKRKQSVIGCIRQPSGGPTTNIKGTAAGGGNALLIPMTEFSMGLTGDINDIMKLITWPWSL